MYESYTRQALPSKNYRELLGTALCVFNANNSFIIENILRTNNDNYDWYKLIDKESGKLDKYIKETITKNSNNEIEKLFIEIVEKRNRIIHSYQITDQNGEQILATKTRQKDGSKQFNITEKYLLEFIELNQKLSSSLHDYRGY